MQISELQLGDEFYGFYNRDNGFIDPSFKKEYIKIPAKLISYYRNNYLLGFLEQENFGSKSIHSYGSLLKFPYKFLEQHNCDRLWCINNSIYIELKINNVNNKCIKCNTSSPHTENNNFIRKFCDFTK